MKKILATIMALMLALTMTVCAFAEENAADTAPVEKTYADDELVLVVGNSADWTNKLSEPVKITGDGEYTFVVDGMDYAANAITVLFLKDGNGEIQAITDSELPTGLEVVVKTIKVNGEEVAFTAPEETFVLEDGKLVDVCVYNIWATNWFSLDGYFDINSFEMTVDVKFPTESADDAADDTADAPADDTADDTDATEDTPAETGLALAVIPAAVACAAVVFSKKR